MTTDKKTATTVKFVSQTSAGQNLALSILFLQLVLHSE